MTTQFTKDERTFLSQVPSDGGVIGNMTLRQLLGWDNAKYWQVRAGLLEKGEIALGRGKGGSVRHARGDEQLLLGCVPPDGTPVRNPALIKRLNWTHDRYWKVRNKLIDDGVLVAGRGWGGTVARVVDDAAEAEIEKPSPRAPKAASNTSGRSARERDLYEPIRDILTTDWARSEMLTNWWTEITANGGRTPGGKWSRPDLTVVSLQRFKLIPTDYFDVWTFEVKQAGGWDITAIHEAYAHGRFATRVCALFQIPEDMTKQEQQFRDCMEEAGRLGVGLITATNVGDYATWEVRLPTTRREPSKPETMEDFLADNLSEEGKAAIRTWRAHGSHRGRSG